jgi:hypothetical protein
MGKKSKGTVSGSVGGASASARPKGKGLPKSAATGDVNGPRPHTKGSVSDRERGPIK